MLLLNKANVKLDVPILGGASLPKMVMLGLEDGLVEIDEDVVETGVKELFTVVFLSVVVGATVVVVIELLKLSAIWQVFMRSRRKFWLSSCLVGLSEQMV